MSTGAFSAIYSLTSNACGLTMFENVNCCIFLSYGGTAWDLEEPHR